MRRCKRTMLLARWNERWGGTAACVGRRATGAGWRRVEGEREKRYLFIVTPNQSVDFGLYSAGNKNRPDWNKRVKLKSHERHVRCLPLQRRM